MSAEPRYAGVLRDIDRKIARDTTPVATPEVCLVNAASIKPEPIKWLWPGWLAAGKLHILAGAPGAGKTSVALGLAAALATAGRWPDHSEAPLGDRLIWSGEDDPRDTLVPRLLACGSDLARVHIVSGVVDQNGHRPYDPATDTLLLREAARGIGAPVRLIIVDPIVSAMAGDSHKNAETRRALQPLVDHGQALRAAVLGISHFSKGTAGRDPLDRVTGSLAFGALARIVLAATKLPDEDRREGVRLLARAKSNIGPDEGGYHYQLDLVEVPNAPGVQATG
jgi:putative DNA primase/helicase